LLAAILADSMLFPANFAHAAEPEAAQLKLSE
jgi:hypothetical protein